MNAVERWAAELGAWRIPDEILAAAPESPWGFPPELFAAHPAGHPVDDSPSLQRAREALSDGGSVLDVGAGGGAGSVPLVPPAGRLIAVDEGRAMLDNYAEAATTAGLSRDSLRLVEGRWPDVADRVSEADVVVCHHVLYNVPDIEPFVAALVAHARRRVVVELTAAHPMTGLNDLWRHFHDLDRPDGPTADDAVAVLSELAIDPHVERFERPSRWAEHPEAYLPFARRRLCLPAERDAEIAPLLPPHTPRELVTLWWDV